MDYCKYTDVFQGTGETALPKPQGIAAKWFALKARCGNTSPAACLPFSAMSVAPYSGGYPTGYGNHYLNTHSLPKKFRAGKGILGFAHLQQSGIGAIGYYYNYVLVSPQYPTSPKRRLPQNEIAAPGYYSCSLETIKCELTVTSRCALHRYTFGDEKGRVALDFTNNGLCIPGTPKKTAQVKSLKSLDENTIVATILAEGITLYFAVKSNVPLSAKRKRAVCFAEGNGTVELSVSLSLKSEEKAVDFLGEADSFDSVKEKASEKWNNALSKIEIEAKDEATKQIFYSNLYHSLIKPCDFSGESFVYSGDKPFFTDFATLWDMYKTALPLTLMCYEDTGKKISQTLMNLGEALGQIPNSLGLSDKYKLFSEQARCLGDYVLMTAYRYGVEADVHRMLKVIENDVFSPDRADFYKDGKCKCHTWTLDMADCCALACQIADEVGETAIKERLAPLAEHWKSCYSEETGLLKNDCPYYEGTLYNYSFRQTADMEKRMEFAKGKEGFAQLLDSFFGYGAPDTVQPTSYRNYEPVRKGFELCRFEGFNNEPDMETPYSYIYADRHDRTCEIIRAGLKYAFSTGTGGLAGNNDSGALSSFYVFSAMGIFPVAGQNLFLLGSPAVDSAKIKLYNGNTLSIKAIDNSDQNIYVKKVLFNNKEIKDFRISATDLLSGGELIFEMSK